MRLKKIKAEYGDKVDVQYRVFMLRPEPDPSAVFNDYRKNHWTNANSQPDSGNFTMWESEEEFPNCSMPSAEAGLAARFQGPEEWERFHDNLLGAFFTENRNISDKKTVDDVAEESGLDMDRYRDALESGGLREKAVKEYMEATNLGITGIPSVVVNDHAVMVGAVPAEQYRYVIDSILKTGELPGRPSGELPLAE